MDEERRKQIVELGAAKLVEAFSAEDRKGERDALRLVNSASRFLTASCRDAPQDGSDEEQEEAESPAA